VGRTVILGDGQTVMTELDLQNNFTFDDLDELQQAKAYLKLTAVV
jgi:hypothetical protein